MKEYFRKALGGEPEGDAPIEPSVLAESYQRRPLPIDVDEEKGLVYILETAIPLCSTQGSLRPHPDRFRHFTLDERTLQTIEKMATAVELRQPGLLEGETSTSKTSSIEFLAMIAGHQVVRLNLNGQTDTSELIGKFVPNDGQVQIQFEEALAHPDLLSQPSRVILEHARSAGRGLTTMESQKIAANEHIDVPEWRWQDGIIPEAMTRGHWVILDELNFAEPQILERLNSVLEKTPQLTVSENDGAKIGPGGAVAVHENFRIFGTMNPAEYSGRSAMSPAYKDRWTAYKYVEAPVQEDYLAMMRLLVYGEQPEVTVRGETYRAEAVEPLFETLREVPNFETFLFALSKFQVEIEGMARSRTIGKQRKEKYIFTRRGLLELFEYLSRKSFVDRASGTVRTIHDDPKEIICRAIEFYFLDRIAGPEDRQKVLDQLSALGMSREQWTLELDEESQRRAQELALEREAMERLVGTSVRIAGSDSEHANEVGVVMGISENAELLRVRVNGCSALHEYSDDDLRTEPGLGFLSTNDEAIFVTEKQEYGGWRVGDRLRTQSDIDVSPEVHGASEIVVVGMTDNDTIIAQLDGGRVMRGSALTQGRLFEHIDDQRREEYESYMKERVEQVREMVGKRVHVKEGSHHGQVGTVESAVNADDPESDLVVRFSGGCSHRFSMDAIQETDEVETGEAVKTFRGVNGGLFKATDQQELDGWKVGDRLRVRPGTSVRAEVRAAKEIIVVGITANGEIITQLDGARVTYDSPSEIGRFFAKESEDSQDADGATADDRVESEAVVFTGMDGASVEVTDQQELDGWKVGDRLRVRPGTSVRAEVRAAKEIIVVGITANDEIVTQLDGGRVVVDSAMGSSDYFEVVREDE